MRGLGFAAELAEAWVRHNEWLDSLDFEAQAQW
jgi:hypothetical protein